MTVNYGCGLYVAVGVAYIFLGSLPASMGWVEINDPLSLPFSTQKGAMWTGVEVLMGGFPRKQ